MPVGRCWLVAARSLAPCLQPSLVFKSVFLLQYLAGAEAYMLAQQKDRAKSSRRNLARGALLQPRVRTCFCLGCRFAAWPGSLLLVSVEAMQPSLPNLSGGLTKNDPPLQVPMYPGSLMVPHMRCYGSGNAPDAPAEGTEGSEHEEQNLEGSSAADSLPARRSHWRHRR
jgi:hypothetical protein